MVPPHWAYVYPHAQVAAHAAGLVLSGRHSSKLHRAYVRDTHMHFPYRRPIRQMQMRHVVSMRRYTLFYVIGTALAIQVCAIT